MSGFIRLVYSLTALVLLAVPCQAYTFNFVDPNFSSGGLNTQGGWVAGPGWTVDSTSPGFTSTTTNSDIATYSQPITLTSPSDTFSYSVNFEHTGSYVPDPNAFVYTFMSGLRENLNTTGLAIGSTAADANVQIFQNTNTYRLLNNFSTLPGASAIDPNDPSQYLNAGDKLQFDYTLTLGTDPNDTSYSVRLQNLTDGTDTGTGTVTGIDSSIYNALTGTGAYAFFQNLNPGAGFSGLTGSRVNSISGDFPAPPPGPTTIEFVGPEFVDGPLNNQEGWKSAWTVADSAGAGNVSTSSNNTASTYGEPIVLAENDIFSASVALEMTGALDPNDSGFDYLFQVGLKDNNLNSQTPTASATSADTNIQLLNTTGPRSYRLLNGFGTIPGAGTITADPNVPTSGIDGGDQLQLDYVFTMGADPNVSSYSVRLQNLTDGTDTGLGTVTGVTPDIFNALSGTGGYFFFETIGPLGPGFDGVQVNSVTATLPEPPPGPTLIEFTDPNFSNGPLNFQQGWRTETEWTVADAAGLGNVSTTAGGDGATYQEAISLEDGETFTASVNLELDGGAIGVDPNLGSFTYLFQTGLKDNNSEDSIAIGDGSAPDVNIQLGETFYRLLNNFTTISGAGTIGHDPNGTATERLDAGDELQLDFALTMGADPNLVVIEVSLSNLTDGTTTGTGTIDGIDPNTFALLDDPNAGAFFFFQSNFFGANDSGISGVQVNSIRATLPDPTPFTSIPGDFNFDGRVDAQDFLEWQRNPSIGNLSDWEANYGLPTTANATAVPEPSAVTMLGLAALGMLSTRRRK